MLSLNRCLPTFDEETLRNEAEAVEKDVPQISLPTFVHVGDLLCLWFYAFPSVLLHLLAALAYCYAAQAA